MATPLTDSINALTRYANETTGKQDTTLSDAVGSLVEGYGQGGFNPFAYVFDCASLFRDTVIPVEDLVLDFSGNTTITSLYSMFLRASGVKHITIKNLVSNYKRLNMTGFVNSTYDLETITFENCSFQPQLFESFGRGCSKLTTINGEIDCSNCANMNYVFNNSNNLKHFRFKENTISVVMNGFGGGTAHYTDESYISLANALNPSSPHSIQASTALKTDVANITGTNDNGTFVADENGTLTLADFITTVKGWTLA